MESTAEQTPAVNSQAQASIEPQNNSQNTSTPPHSSHKKGIHLSLTIALVLLFIGGLFLAVWYFQAQLKDSNQLTTKPAPTTAVSVPKKLVVGTDPTLPPMEFLEGKELSGYDIDFANFIAKELGTEIEYKNIVFDDLFPALEKQEIDMIISAVTITDERKKKYDFSEAYINAGQVIITKKDNTTIKSTSDLRGKKIAVQKGTTNENEALKYTDDKLVIRTADFVQATTALVNGKVDAIFTEVPNAKGITTANPTLKISSDPFTNEYYGIVFRKGDPAIKHVNEAITSLRVKGILTDLKQKWLD